MAARHHIFALARTSTNIVLLKEVY